MGTFSPNACVRFGWETFKKRPWFFVGVTVLTAVIGGIASMLSNSTDYFNQATTPANVPILLLAALGVLTGLIIQTLLKMGTIQFVLRAHDAPEGAEVVNLWAPHPFWKYVIASILLGIVVVVGLILLIVPGIIWGLRYMFVPYLVMERDLGASDAMKESARITYGYKWQLLGFVLLLGLVNILGLLCLVVGLLVSIPVTSLAFVHAYRTLSENAGTPVEV